MKKLVLLLFSILFIACSSNEEVGTNEPGEPSVDFPIPLNLGKFWTYKVLVAGSPTVRDSLFVESDVIINNKTYKKFKSRNNVGNGFYTSSIKNNAVREDGNKLLLTGNFSIPVSGGLTNPIDIALEDFVIFNKYASNGTLLSSKSGTFQQTINNYPLTFEYTLKSEAGESFTNYVSPNSVNYSDVKSTKIVLNLKITSVQNILGQNVTLTVLSPQDVLVSKQFLAKGKGVVHTNTVSGYTLTAQIANQLGIPATSTQTQNEYLDTFN
jgi:hypothetical protein